MDALVTYDIADVAGAGAKRLRRVADVCCKYGQRVQYSVFECRLSPVKLARMVDELRDVIDEECDSVIIYQFPKGIKLSTICLGKNKSQEIGQSWIL